MSDETIRHLQGMLGGVVTQHQRWQRLKYYDWSRLCYAPLPLRPDQCVPALHCWRSVSKRTLSTPHISASNPFITWNTGAVAFFNVLEQSLTPPIVGFPNPPGPNQFWNNNVNDGENRGRVNGLVLIGMRAHVRLATVLRGGTPRWRANAFTRALADTYKNFVYCRVFSTADRNDPWLNDVPLAYLDRPDRRFVAVPPMLWTGRSALAEVYAVVGDFGAGAGALPNISTTQGGGLQLRGSLAITVIIEGLFTPPPDTCPDVWPGSFCPPEIIKNHPRYDADYLRG